MNGKFKKYFKRLTIYWVIIALLSFFISALIPVTYRTPTLPYLLLFYFIMTALTGFIILIFANKKFSKFVNIFMLATVGKLLLYLFIIIIYLFFINRKDAIGFISSFFIYYLLFTIFETIQILVLSKKEWLHWYIPGFFTSKYTKDYTKERTHIQHYEAIA